MERNPVGFASQIFRLQSQIIELGGVARRHANALAELNADRARMREENDALKADNERLRLNEETLSAVVKHLEEKLATQVRS